MSIFGEVLKEELQRADSPIHSYEEILSKCPKGYVSIVQVKGKSFAYWKWREGAKIKSKYIGPKGSEKEKEARAHYSEKKRIEANLKEAKNEREQIRKASRIIQK